MKSKTRSLSMSREGKSPKAVKPMAFIDTSIRFQTMSAAALPCHFGIQRGIAEAVRPGEGACHYFDATLDLPRFVASGGHRAYRGLVLFAYWSDEKTLRACNDLYRRVPCVSIAIEPVGGPSAYVGLDEGDAVDRLVDHLVKQGCRRIGYVGKYGQSFSHRRHGAYRAAMAQHGLSIEEAHAIGPAADRFRSRGPWDGAKAGEKIWIPKSVEGDSAALFGPLFAHGKYPEAILFETDQLAQAFYFEAKGRGMGIPKDVAIAGIDGSALVFGDRGPRFLTSVEQDFVGLGRAAAHLLDDVSTGRKDPRTRVLLKGRLLPRASTVRRADPGSAIFKDHVVSTLETSFAEVDLIDVLARDLELSRHYFLVKFKKRFGMDFTDFVNAYRVDRAAFLLKTTERPVTEILWDSGFRTHQNFNRWFRRRMGCSPNAWRARHAPGHGD